MARMDPTPEQWQLLNQGFSSAFVDLPSLENLIQIQMGANPSDVISERVNRQTAIRQMLQWALSDEALDTLLVRARNAKPTNSLLRKAAEAFDLAPSSTGLESLLRAGNNEAEIETFIRSLSAAELAVCRVEIGGEAAGTGFLVGPDLVLTCYHVLESVLEGGMVPNEVVSRFDYKRSAAAGELQPGVPYRLGTAWKVDASPKHELDFALVRLERKAGEEPVAGKDGTPPRGWLQLARHGVQQTQSIYMIQHPLGAAMKISLGMVVSLDEAAGKICHDAPTDRGSSGSPCFAMDGKVVGVHQHGQDHGNLGCAKNGAVRSGSILGKPGVAAALR